MQVNARRQRGAHPAAADGGLRLPLKDDGVIGPMTARAVANGDGERARAPGRRLRHRAAQLLLPPRPTSVRPAANTPAPGTAARAAGSSAPRSSSAERFHFTRARARREGRGMGMMGRILGAARRGPPGRRAPSAASPRSSSATAPSARRPTASRCSPPLQPVRAGVRRAGAGAFRRLRERAEPVAAAAAGGRNAGALRLCHGGAGRLLDCACRGLALVPEPLWWLLGAIVSFYFGARELHYQRDRARSSPRARSRPSARRPRPAEPDATPARGPAPPTAGRAAPPPAGRQAAGRGP